MVTTTVVSVHQMTPDVKQFRLRRSEGTFEYDPGQHTTVQFEDDGEEVVRPYTPTSLPGTDEVTLAIKRYDDGTASVWMHDRERGDEVELGELEGNLHLRDPERDAAFVATGTGITPMMAMLKEYVDRGEGDAHFYFGEKDQRHLVYRETLDQFEASYENVHVTFSLSDEAWDGPTGHVQHHVVDAVGDELDPEGTDVYVCGVPDMVVETQEDIVEAGVPEENVYAEGWEDDEVSEDS
ncbi:ferredoxin--NADP reductase [Candidatus Halobonum tyrrellensis]|uniref:Flavodoxin reductase family protein n=1 Tax=Candidatus Halobonum tyrrellensis G22 TaxID=1324957 RepID=V4HKS7_9EURY|nr:FAD-dependent oxidoreductase [Candidatus Halobonum tyrrellensis]ESP88529.1 flavodoxin reductase family protein [Candidatus Halobonum tyrrellensis G22]